ncbi:MAG TPA: TetR family transcriptional regulator C-terminal domain-containing protein [Pseudolysinimonas sp.]|nr:TetR family transcriptional regulator C-terminal domain-containing protein [Pseudolysinimonas sp.]
MAATDRREALARAALAVIARDGVHAATTRAIVAEAGMPLASFHYAVASRDELLRDVVELVVGSQDSAAFSTLELDARDIRSAIRGVLGSIFDILRADPARQQAMFELTQYALRTPALGDFPIDQYGVYRGLAARLLDAGAIRYRVRWDAPVSDLATLAVALSDGATMSWLATRDDVAAERLLDLAADAIAAHAIPLTKENP